MKTSILDRYSRVKTASLILILCSLFLSPSAMAQFGTQDRQAQPFVSSAPAPSFHSTSTMAGTGSAYAAQPMLNADGTAAYGASSATAAPGRTSGPRKANTLTGDEEDLPLGDAVLPLIAFAMVFCGYIAIRRRRKALKG